MKKVLFSILFVAFFQIASFAQMGNMQIDGKEVQEVPAGKSVGIKVADRVRPGDLVYKVH